MCEPTTIAIASTAMAATQSVVSYMGAMEQANQMNDAYERNASASIDAFQDDIEASNMSSMAAQEEATQRRMQASADGLAARGAARAAAGARGITGGLTVAALERDLGFQEGRNIASINRNSQLSDQRYRMNTRGARNAAQSRINSAPRSNGPSLLALGADLGNAAVGGYTMRSNLRANAQAGT